MDNNAVKIATILGVSAVLCMAFFAASVPTPIPAQTPAQLLTDSMKNKISAIQICINDADYAYTKNNNYPDIVSACANAMSLVTQSDQLKLQSMLKCNIAANGDVYNCQHQ